MNPSIKNWKYNNAAQLTVLSIDELIEVENDLREAIRQFADVKLKLDDEMFWLLGAIINEKKKRNFVTETVISE